MNDLLLEIEKVDQEYDQTANIVPQPDNKPETVEELKEQINKIQLAKDKILDYALELLDTPLAPKDLKDLVSIINSLEGKQEDKNQVNIVIQNIMNKFVDDV
jgi:hypothetical protein